MGGQVNPQGILTYRAIRQVSLHAAQALLFNSVVPDSRGCSQPLPLRHASLPQPASLPPHRRCLLQGDHWHSVEAGEDLREALSWDRALQMKATPATMPTADAQVSPTPQTYGVSQSSHSSSRLEGGLSPFPT